MQSKGRSVFALRLFKVIVDISSKEVYYRRHLNRKCNYHSENLSCGISCQGKEQIYMTSKNGSQELISLLQYMKETRLDNPEVLVKDKRIVELDEIVTEVKESEEWEGIKMNILDIGIARGEEESMKKIIRKMLLRGMSDEEILEITECEKEVLEQMKTEQND